MLTLLVLSFAVLVIGGGLPAVEKAAKAVAEQADAQLLLSVGSAAVRAELVDAGKVREDGEFLWLYSVSRGCWVRIEERETSLFLVAEQQGNEQKLLTEQTVGEGLALRLQDLTWEEESGTFRYTIAVFRSEQRGGSIIGSQTVSVRPGNR